MATRAPKVLILLAGIVVGSACSGETVLPDAQVHAPGSIRNDGGLGLGSGGATPPPPESGSSASSNGMCEDGGLGLGSGGRVECPTEPTS